MSRFAILAAALLLAGCATATGQAVSVQTVKVPITVKCAADPGPEPVYADTPDALHLASDIYDRVKLLLEGRDQRTARIIEVTQASAGCR